MKSNYNIISFIVITSLALYGCKNELNFRYSEIEQVCVKNFDYGFSEYCLADFNYNFEDNAVKASFYGEYQRALDQRAIMQKVSLDPAGNIDLGGTEKEYAIQQLMTVLQDIEISDNDKIFAQDMLEVLNTPSAQDRFASAKSVSAIQYITDQAKDFHFTLINEAHYNSQHRSFTSDLLEPLWNQGYRYLALETLNHTDTDLHHRGYPTNETGYYIQDSNFGNMVREALRLGYKLVHYENQNGYEGTLRDRDQANNILEKTWKQDQIGKVLIHAGYGHISEYGDESYEPMGFQLKNLVGQEILTIDQEAMINFQDSNKQHPYYQEASYKSKITEPTIFLDNSGKVIIDPINSFGIDIQIYHPETHFVSGRPDWMLKKGTKKIPLSAGILEYNGHLIQAVKSGEEIHAVPVDQFIISAEKEFILAPGFYDLRVINCDGDIVASQTLDVK